MMHPDIGGEPVQNRWQVVMRAAMKGGIMMVPSRCFGPPCLLELMLHVKQPNADGCRKQCDRPVHKKKRPNTHKPYHHHDYQRDGCVGRHSTKPGAPIGHQPDWHPVLHDEKISWTQTKHDDGVAIEAVSKTAPPT